MILALRRAKKNIAALQGFVHLYDQAYRISADILQVFSLSVT
jgi:hypothetical protein